MDGSDPRAPGGALSASAVRYDSAIELPNGTTQMMARTRSGGAWSAARPMIFHVGGPSFTITEATAGYVEITNNGSTAVDLEYWRLQGDVRHKFDYNRSPIVRPGESVVIAEDAAVFQARWGVAPDGQFLDNINATDTLRLVDTELKTQHEVVTPLLDDGVPGNAVPPVPVAGDPPGLILNEWNAVSSSGITDDPDPLLGRVAGNGGDWFEVVTVNDVDLRGWILETSDVDSVGTVQLTNDAIWADVPAGAIITFSQNPVVAENGRVYGTDTSFDPDTDDWWIHIVTDEANAYVEQTTFPVSSSNWRLRILNAAQAVQWGPVGEGVGALLGGLGSSEIGELETNPSDTLDPAVAPYDDGNSSTFGAPNAFSDTLQNFSFLRGDAPPGTNTNCDNTLTIVDALFIAQFAALNRADTGSCPLADPTTEINAAAGDINLAAIRTSSMHC